MRRDADVAIIGGGVLGACIAYWIASSYDASVHVIDKERAVARHSTMRNTGVVHSPFYIDPTRRPEMAAAMVESRAMWRELAARTGAPWLEMGILEVATDASQVPTLEKYAEWGQANGLDGSDVRLLDAAQVAELEPGVRCAGALHSARDVSTDYAFLTSSIAREAESLGARFTLGEAVSAITPSQSGMSVTTSRGSLIEARLVINCAGNFALGVAQMAGQAAGHTALHFRGEYWSAGQQARSLVGTTVYSVPRFPEYPFLDPHWIVRADGRVEVGPNAVPVAGPEAYSGTGGCVRAASKIAEILAGPARSLLADGAFVRMAAAEWRSSLSKSAMIERVRSFVPRAEPSMFEARGIAGIRTPIVLPDGTLADDTIEIAGERVYSILNYNSPGATGAPAYAARLVERMRSSGHLDFAPRSGWSVWQPPA